MNYNPTRQTIDIADNVVRYRLSVAHQCAFAMFIIALEANA